MSSSAHRERIKSEREFFRMMAEKGEALSWAERSPVAPRRREMRAARIAEAAGLLGLESGEGLRVLDVGCGTGSYSRPLALSTSANIVSIDVTPEVLAQAREQLPENATPVAANAMQLPFPDESFDVVLGNAILHHLLPLDDFVPELTRVIKPGGRFCFAEPNLYNPHLFALFKVPGLKSFVDCTPDEYPFTRRGLRRDLERLGLIVHEVTPFDFMYPMIPAAAIKAAEALGTLLEATPWVREIAGSLLVRAEKPSA